MTLAEIEALVRSKVQEGQQLELKRSVEVSGNGISREHQQDLCRTVCGFANSGGGRIVYGVETRKSNGLDIADSLKPISDVVGLAEIMLSLLTNHISQPIKGIKVIAVEGANPPSGFVVIDVPASDIRPHQSTISGDHRFYKRSADATLVMSRIDIQDQFARVQTPQIDASLNIRNDGSIGSRKSFACEFVLSNQSLASAKSSYLIMELQKNLGPGYDDPSKNFGYSRSYTSKNEIVYLADPHLVLHPTMELKVTRRVFFLERHADNFIRLFKDAHETTPADETCLRVRVRWGCESARPRQSLVTIHEEGLEDLFDGSGKLAISFSSQEEEALRSS